MTTHDDDAAINAARPEPEFIAIDFDPSRMRSIIEGLRSLPNVAEMPIINAISEMDRLTNLFERAAKRRAEMAKQLVEAMRKSVLSGDMTATDGCECPRCEAIRIILSQNEPRQQLNS
jgi:hypothetical protein